MEWVTALADLTDLTGITTAVLEMITAPPATMELVTALLETLKDLTDLTLPGLITFFLAVSPLLTQNSQI